MLAACKDPTQARAWVHRWRNRRVRQVVSTGVRFAKEAVQMRSIHRKLALGLAAGITSLGLFGAAAFGAFGPEASATAGLTIPDAAAAVGKDRPDKLQAVLATLVQKGVITQA